MEGHHFWPYESDNVCLKLGGLEQRRIRIRRATCEYILHILYRKRGGRGGFPGWRDSSNDSDNPDQETELYDMCLIVDPTGWFREKKILIRQFDNIAIRR